MPDTITYGKLYDKLVSYGYEQSSVTADGKNVRIFEHPNVAGAMIVLPDRDENDLVEQLYLSSVWAKLRSRGILPPEKNPLLS